MGELYLQGQDLGRQIIPVELRNPSHKLRTRHCLPKARLLIQAHSNFLLRAEPDLHCFYPGLVLLSISPAIWQVLPCLRDSRLAFQLPLISIRRFLQA